MSLIIFSNQTEFLIYFHGLIDTRVAVIYLYPICFGLHTTRAPNAVIATKPHVLSIRIDPFVYIASQKAFSYIREQ